jgi:hypothetical protein
MEVIIAPWIFYFLKLFCVPRFGPALFNAETDTQAISVWFQNNLISRSSTHHHPYDFDFILLPAELTSVPFGSALSSSGSSYALLTLYFRPL